MDHLAQAPNKMILIMPKNEPIWHIPIPGGLS
jgi:hypothetical protein